MSPDGDIGDIAINGSAEVKAPRRPSRGRKRRAKRPPHRKSKKRATGRKKLPFLLRFVAVCLLLITLAVVGSFFFVPALIKGPVAQRLSARLQLPLRIERAFFHPFDLTLRLEDLSVGTGKEGSAPPLIQCSLAEFDLEAVSLLKRGFICKTAHLDGVDIQLIRDGNRSYNLIELYRTLIGASPGGSDGKTPQKSGLLFSINNILIDNSRLTFIDRPTGKTHQLEQIHFSLPVLSNFPYEIKEYIHPEFSALVNSTPVRMTGKSRILTDESVETRLELQLDGLDLAAYAAYLPFLDAETQLTGGRADGTVWLAFTGSPGSGMQLTLRGKAELQELHLQEKDHRDLLLVPRGRIAWKMETLNHRWDITELVLDGPTLHLYGNKERQSRLLSGWRRFFAADPESRAEVAPEVHVGRLTITRGETVIHHPKKTETWKPVSLTLSNLTNRTPAAPDGRDEKKAAFTLTAGRGSGAEAVSLLFDGTVSPAGKLSGSFKADNINPANNGLFPLPRKLSFHRGTAHLAGGFRYDPTLTAIRKNQEKLIGGLHLVDTNVTIRDVEVRAGDRRILVADTLSCKQLNLDFQARQQSCWRLDLRNGVLHLNRLPPRKPETDQWRRVIHNIGINGFTVAVTLPPPTGSTARPAPLRLRDFSLEGADLQERETTKTNIVAAMRLDTGASLQLEGRYSLPAARGNLQISLKDLDGASVAPYLAAWLKPPLASGRFYARGEFLLPSRRFSGIVWVEDFRAGPDEKNPLIGWQQAFAAGVSFNPKPFHLGISEITVSKPFLRLEFTPGTENNGRVQAAAGPPASFFRLPRQQPPKRSDNSGTTLSFSAVDINTIRFEDGTFLFVHPPPAPKQQFTISRLNGSVKHFSLSTAGKTTFALTGALEPTGELIMRGTCGFDGTIRQSLIQVYNYTPTPFVEPFRRDPGFNLEGARVDITRELKRQEGRTVIRSRLDFHDIDAEDQGIFADTVALLTDGEGSFSLRIDTEQDDDPGRPGSSLTQGVRTTLQGYRLKAALSPFLLLRERGDAPLPDEKILFSAGRGELTDEARRILDGYWELLLKHPHLSLVMTTGFDPEADGEVIRQQLQQEADNRRAEENRRRAEKRRRFLLEEKKRLEKTRPAHGKITEEPLAAGPPIPPELEDLPPVRVTVPEKMLEELALRRSAGIIDYLVQAGIDENRLLLTGEVNREGARIDFTLKAGGNQP